MATTPTFLSISTLRASVKRLVHDIVNLALPKGTNGDTLEGDVSWNVDVKPIGNIYVSVQITHAATSKCAAQSKASEVFGKDKSTGHPSCEGLNKPDNILIPNVFVDRVKNVVKIP